MQGQTMGKLGIYLVADCPSRGTFLEAVWACQDLGVDFLEIGFPFSDPVADGPVIQASYTDALAEGIKLVDILKMQDCLEPKTPIDEAQGFLERVISQKEDAAAHEFFRTLVEKNLKAIAKWRKSHPDDATPPPEILPPPKFKMLAKSQPLPPMKDEDGNDFDAHDHPAVLEHHDEPDADVPDEDVEFEAPVEGEPVPPPKGSEPKGAKKGAAKSASKPAAKAAGKSSAKKK